MESNLTAAEPKPVVIVGAGAAGLTCGAYLRQQHISFVIVEASDAVGGRIRSDQVEGFTLDRGFQVFQTAYPEAKMLLDYEPLQLVELEPGAWVRAGGKWNRMSDPLRRPSDLFATLFNSIGNVGDRFKLLKMRRELCNGDWRAKLASTEDMSTLELLRDHYRFSDSFVSQFLRPWLAGIFLERELTTSANYFAFVFKMLSGGPICYPQAGIGAITQQLAAKMKPRQIQLSTPVESIRQGETSHLEVHFAKRKPIEAAAVVLATDLNTAARLSDQAVTPRPTNSTCCIYFAAPSPPHRKPVLMLDGEQNSGPVNHVFVMTNASAKLAPRGKTLISVNLVGDRVAEADDSAAIRGQLQAWFGDQVSQWEELARYSIEHALPQQMPGFYASRESAPLPRGWFLCGDHAETTSLNGAMQSGKVAAKSVAEFLSVSQD